MNKNKFFLIGLLAALLSFGLVLAGCDNGSGGNNDVIPAKLVGTWGLNSPYSQFFQINSDGSGTYGNYPTVGCTWRANSSTLTLELLGTSCTVDWTISVEGKLTLSNAKNASGVTTEMAFAALNGIAASHPNLDKLK
jgi:hypothetical protein